MAAPATRATSDATEGAIDEVAALLAKAEPTRAALLLLGPPFAPLLSTGMVKAGSTVGATHHG